MLLKFVIDADMVRVGALRRISKSLLPHSLHAVDSKANSSAVSELKDMLANSGNAADAALIQRELDQFKEASIPSHDQATIHVKYVCLSLCAELHP